MPTPVAITFEGVPIMNTEERFHALERSVRRWRRFTIAMAVLATGSIMLAMESDAPEEIVVRKMTIVDSDGRSRVILGGSGLIFADESERPRIVMATLDNDAAAIQHFDPDGRRRIAIGTFAQGGASVLHIDPDRRIRLESGTYSNGDARLTQFDSTGTPRLSLSTDQTGSSSIETSDPDGVPRVVIATGNDGLAELRFDDQFGRTRLHDRVEADGRASRALNREDVQQVSSPEPDRTPSAAKGG